MSSGKTNNQTEHPLSIAYATAACLLTLLSVASLAIFGCGMACGLFWIAWVFADLSWCIQEDHKNGLFK